MLKVLAKALRLFIATVSIALIFSMSVQTPTFATQGVTVSFVANDGQLPLQTAFQIAQSGGSANLTSFAVLFPNVVYPGHTFSYWSNQPGGGGVTYTDGAPFPFLNDGTLYAQWIGPSHTVTFAENRNSADMTETPQIANSPTPLTLFSNLSPKFSNPNYTFAGWNTSADGSGTGYADGAFYSFASAVILFALWTPNNETVLFSPNTGVGTVPPMLTPFGSSISLPIGSNLTKSNYSFGGWNTMPDGSGTFYPPGAVISVQTSQTLYASWARNTFVVSFLIPGVKGKVAPISVPAGGAIDLRSSSKLVNPGFTFSGWYTAPVGGEFVGDGGATYEPTRSMALYAHWKGNQNVNLEFSDNGGVGHVKARTIHQGLGVIIPDGSLLHRPGYAFRGWASNPRASVPSVRIGAKFVLTRTKILYALWRRDVPASTPQVLLGSVGMFAPNSSSLTATMRRFIASLAADINRRDRTQVLLYGYATSVDSVHGSGLLSLKRAIAVKNQLNDDLAGLNDVGVTLRASGEGRLSNSVLASFRNVEVFAN